MNDLQTWSTIAGVLAVLFAFVSLVLKAIDRSLVSMQDSLKFMTESMNGRFDRLEARVDGLDRDVTMLIRRQYGDQ